MRMSIAAIQKNQQKGRHFRKDDCSLPVYLFISLWEDHCREREGDQNEFVMYADFFAT